MKKGIRKSIAAIALATALVASPLVGLGSAPVSVQAASKKVKKVKFKASSYYVRKGKSYTLSNKLVFTPKKPSSKKVTWKSYKKSIATVSSKGKVKAKRIGNAKIRVVTKSGKKKAYTTVRVRYALPNFKVTNGTSVTKNVGEKHQINLSSVSTKKYYLKSTTYKSSNTGVATVDSKGYITAKAAGTSTITVTRKGFNTKKAYMKITVTKPADPNKDRTITAAGTYSNLTGTATIKGSTTGVVTINSSNITTLTLENGDYEVNVNGTTINEVQSAVSGLKSAKAIAGVPMINFGDNTTVNTVTVNSPLNVNVAAANAVVKAVAANAELDVAQSVAPTTPIATVTVNTNSAVSVAANTTTLTLSDGQANVSVDAKVDALNVQTTDANNTATVKLKEAAQVTTLRNTTPVLVSVENKDVKLSNVVAANTITFAGVAQKEIKVDSVTVQTDKPVAVTVATTEIKVEDAAAKVTVGANIDKVTLSVDTTNDTPAITVEPNAKVDKVELTEGTTKVDISGTGDVTEVVVPETMDKEDVANNIKVPPTTPIVDTNSTVVEAAKKVLNDAIKTVEGEMTKFEFPTTDSEYYKVTKNDITSSITAADIDKIMGYFAKPASAYAAWIDPATTLPLDGSGTVVINSVSGNNNAKDIVVNGTEARDGTYRAVLTQDGANYKLVVTDKDGKEHNATIVPGETATLTSANYLVEATATTVKVTRKEDNQVVFKAEKTEHNYVVSVLTEKVGDTNIQYLAVPQS